MIRVLAIVALLLIVACDKKEKIDTKNYIDLSTDVPTVAEVSKSSKKIVITSPKASSNKSWTNSAFKSSDVPQNIAAQIKGSSETYQLKGRFTSIEHLTRAPIISNNIMYYMDDEHMVYAYNDLGNLQWQQQVHAHKDHDFLGGGLAIKGNVIVLTYGSYELIALDATSGEKIWSKNLSNISRSAPTINGDRVFVNTVDNKLYCLDLATGKINWIYTEGLDALGVIGSISPTIYKNMVILAHSTGAISFNTQNGELLWNANLNTTSNLPISDVDATPVVSGDDIYISNYQGNIYSVNVKNNHLNWNNDTIGGNRWMLVSGDYLYSINKHKQLVATQKSNGRVQWIYDLKQEATANTVFSGPVMVNGELYITSSNGLVLVFSNTGEQLKTIEITKNVYHAPVVVGDAVYLLSDAAKLSVIN